MQDTLWKKFLEKASSAVALAFFTLIAYAELFVFASGGFFETNRALCGYAFLSVLLLAAISALTLYFGVNLFLSIHRPDKKEKSVWCFIAELLTLAIGAAIPFILYYARTFEAATLLVTLPYFLAGLAAAVLLFLIPLVKKNKLFAILAAVITLCAVCGIAAASTGAESVSFEADPVVFDNGEGFSVVWCTNVTSVGYLEYSYEGRNYKIYDAEDGKYRADKRVHTVRVPYEHLYGNTYTVSAAKVVRNSSRYSKLGDFITSEGYTFAEKIAGDEVKMLSLTDWHEKDEKLYAVTEGKAYDVLLMMGDAINYVNEYDDILEHIVIPGGKLTAGVKPVLFVRGNHELRGKYSDEIKSVLGMERYYFTATYGEVNFLVFDGGDTKPDGEESQGVLNVSESYREEELAVMDALPVIETGYNVCLCHIPLFSKELLEEEPKADGADEQALRFAAILEKQGVKLVVSGHEHCLDYIDGDAYDTLIAGGPTEKDGYVACMITVKAGVADIIAFNKEEIVKRYDLITLK